MKHQFAFQASHPSASLHTGNSLLCPARDQPPLSFLSHCLQVVAHLPFQAWQEDKVRSSPVSERTGVPPFLEVRAKPLGFLERLIGVFVFANHEKSEENLCFYEKRQKQKQHSACLPWEAGTLRGEGGTGPLALYPGPSLSLSASSHHSWSYVVHPLAHCVLRYQESLRGVIFWGLRVLTFFSIEINGDCFFALYHFGVQKIS